MSRVRGRLRGGARMGGVWEFACWDEGVGWVGVYVGGG